MQCWSELPCSVYMPGVQSVCAGPSRREPVGRADGPQCSAEFPAAAPLLADTVFTLQPGCLGSDRRKQARIDVPSWPCPPRARSAGPPRRRAALCRSALWRSTGQCGADGRIIGAPPRHNRRRRDAGSHAAVTVWWLCKQTASDAKNGRGARVPPVPSGVL